MRKKDDDDERNGEGERMKMAIEKQFAKIYHRRKETTRTKLRRKRSQANQR